MAGIIIGIVAVIGLVAVTIAFTIKGKEYVSKFDGKIESIERNITKFESSIKYKVDKNEFNVEANNLYMLEKRLQKIEDKIDSYDLKIKDIDKFDNISINAKAIESIQNELKEIKEDIEDNKKSIDEMDDFVAITVED